MGTVTIPIWVLAAILSLAGAHTAQMPIARSVKRGTSAAARKVYRTIIPKKKPIPAAVEKPPEKPPEPKSADTSDCLHVGDGPCLRILVPQWRTYPPQQESVPHTEDGLDTVKI